jgi:anti-anti-sigma regulatory factor
VTEAAVEVIIEDRIGCRVAEVRGVLNVFTASVVGGRILAGLPPDARELVVDLDGIESADSAGVSALVRLYEHARARDVQVRARLGSACSMSPTVVSVLRRVFVVEEVVDLTDGDDAASTRPPVATTN